MDNWQESTLNRLKLAKQHKKEVDEEAQYLAEYIDTLEKAIELDRKATKSSDNGSHPAIREEFKDKSIKQCLILIASKNNNRLNTQLATQELINAGVFTDKDIARNNIFSTLHSSKKSFKKQKAGVYTLTDYGRSLFPQLL